MKTDQQYAAWLNSESPVRCILIEVGVRSGGSELTRYLSNAGFTTGPDEVPANTTYLTVLRGGVNLTESLVFEGVGSLNFGDIELFNPDGSLDTWLNDIWVNRPIKVLFGDKRWKREDFRVVFNGMVADADSRSRDTFNIKLRDKMQSLNAPLTESRLGGTSANANVQIPEVFGEVHNIKPLLIDAATEQYQFHSGYSERIIEVRDEAVPVSITPDLTTGTFRLNQAAAGVITASVQGDKPLGIYKNDIASIVHRLATAYGNAHTRFTDDDIDLQNFADFAAAHTQPVGMFRDVRSNLYQDIQELAASVGAQPVMSRVGKLRLLRINLPASGAAVRITPSDMVEKSLHLVSRTTVAAGATIGYCKNWTVQDKLQTEIPTAHKDLFKQQWLTETVKDPAVAEVYKLYADPVQRDTLLLTQADAIEEATRELTAKKQPRIVLEFVGYANCLLLELGQPVAIEHFRYGLQAGVQAVVTQLTPDYINARVTVQVMI